jgi:hypothetical protein
MYKQEKQKRKEKEKIHQLRLWIYDVISDFNPSFALWITKANSFSNIILQ